MYKEKFVQNLKLLFKGNSVIDISSEIGISYQTIFRYLKGEILPSFENLLKLADYFGEDLDFLTGRRDYP